MGKEIEPIYAKSKDFWNKYPELYTGKLVLNEDILVKEVTKYALGSNEKAKSIGWLPKVDMNTGIKNSVEYAVNVLREGS